MDQLSVLSLFAGAGGLDVGLEAAGFSVRLCVEMDLDARATLQRNRPGWRLAGDIHEYSAKELTALAGVDEGELDLLAGGPPCQPFSKSAYWLAGDSKRLTDPRASTLNAYLRVVDAALPRVILLENVRGLTFRGKDEGLRLLESGLARINRKKKTSYKLTALHLNAANYGVPQFRERVFIVASRDGVLFRAPAISHGEAEGLEPYHTAWDAIGDLDDKDWSDDLAPTGKWARLLPSIPEGENYLHHTPGARGQSLFGWRTRYWSFLLKLAKNRPSWTLQASPGPATGPFHWRSRLLSSHELCRLQTFPDDYVVEGDRRSVQRQMGNAVPCALAECIGREIRSQLLGKRRTTKALKLLPPRRPGCRRKQPRQSVPPEYHHLRGKHRRHPGTGCGPGARRRMKSRQRRRP